MKLYHGSNQAVEKPDPAFSKRIRMDFGKGFYTTTSEEQARKFTHLVFSRSKRKGIKTVSVYDLDISAFSDLVVKDFQGEINEWFDYVEINRRQRVKQDDRYDIVIGPVADDQIQETFVLYEDGIINKKEAIKRLNYEVLKDQIVFKTPRSVNYLRFLESVEVE